MKRLTEYLPALAQSFAVLRVNNVDNRMTVIVIAVPYVPYPGLASQVEELEYGRWERYLSGYTLE